MTAGKNCRYLNLGVLLAGIILAATGCSRQLREGVLSGAANYATDATYGVLAQLLPFPLGAAAPADNSGGDPFTDVPLQM